jgi:hypothetical protein
MQPYRRYQNKGEQNDTREKQVEHAGTVRKGEEELGSQPWVTVMGDGL